MTLILLFSELLADSPPQRLEQEYYECHHDNSEALFQALGIASGNAAMFVPIILFSLLPLLYLYLMVNKLSFLILLYIFNYFWFLDVCIPII